MVIQYKDDSIYPSSMTSQLSSTRDRDHTSLATWTSWMNTNVSQYSPSHHKVDEANDGSTLDASLFDTTMAEPVLPLSLDHESLNWGRGALNVQPALDRNLQPCGRPRYGVSSQFPANDQQEIARLNLWSDKDANLDSLWTYHSIVRPNTENNGLPLDNDRAVHSPPALGDSPCAQIPPGWPGLNVDKPACSTSFMLSSEYLHSRPSRPTSLSSFISPVDEDQGEESKSCASQSLASRKLSCWTTSMPSVEIEDDLSRSPKRRQSKAGHRRQGCVKKSRELPTRKMARHSVIEKRYRTKLNDELGKLRNNVPSVRVIPQRPVEYAYRECKEELDRPQASSKFDKATIVSKAIEYIIYIEMCNKRLSEENMVLIDRLSAIETMASGGARRPE